MLLIKKKNMYFHFLFMKIEFYFYAFFYVHYKFMENGKNCKNINFPIVFQDVENHKMEFYFLFCVSIFPNIL